MNVMEFRGVIAVAIFGACGLNQSGHVGSTKTGDVTHPAERGSPIDELRALCGDGEPTAAGDAVLRRQPYLQQVTLSAAKLGWVTTQPGGARVDLALPGGRALPSTSGKPDDVAVRTAGENQMWSSVDALAPATVYCYALADQSGALTAATGFRTAPAPETDEPVRFLAFGDSGGGGSDQRALLKQMYTVPYDLIIHTGDLAYDHGTIGDYKSTVFDVYADLLRNIPFFPSAGNHDYDTMDGAPFRDVFNLPGDSGEKWYSYDWGRVHFVALDTESDYATQAAWLDRDLAASQLAWKIVYLHRPPYSSGQHGSDIPLRTALAPILEQHKVQLVLAGHDHDYERMEPQHGVAYVVTGGGGKGTRTVGSSAFTAFSEDVIHFVYVVVGSDELVLHAIDAEGREFDSMVVPRN